MYIMTCLVICSAVAAALQGGDVPKPPPPSSVATKEGRKIT